MNHKSYIIQFLVIPGLIVSHCERLWSTSFDIKTFLHVNSTKGLVYITSNKPKMFRGECLGYYLPLLPVAFESLS